jgi:ribosomal protein S18 acetylase RimI-like enzyme
MAPLPPVRPASHDDLPHMAASLALAFADDPVMEWLFGDDRRKVVRRCRRFYAVEGRRHLRHDVVFTTADHSGASYWDPPKTWKTGTRDMLGLAPVMLLAMGPRIPRAVRAFPRIEAVHDRYPPHYYLSLLGTRPDRRGEGIGSALVQEVLERCDAESTGAYLESSKESNIPFYERHGFRVVDEIALPGGPSLWPMWRDPVGSAGR